MDIKSLKLKGIIVCNRNLTVDTVEKDLPIEMLCEPNIIRFFVRTIVVIIKSSNPAVRMISLYWSFGVKNLAIGTIN